MIKVNDYPISDYTIIIENNADETIVTAARELTEYIFKVTGVSLPVATEKQTTRAFYLDNAYAKTFENEKDFLQDDSFLIESVQDGIVVKGKKKEGTLYGVYRILQTYFGVEWYAPDCERAVLLENKEISIQNETYNFPALMRFCHTYEGFNPVFRARQALSYTVGDINDKPSYGNLRGLKFAFSWGYFGHTFELLLPYEEFFLEHPEWFSFAEGFYGINHRYQICLTNPEVFKIVCERVLKYLEQYPDCKIISVSQNDAYAEFEFNQCLCPGCKAVLERDGNYSAVLIEFVNKIAREVAKVRPDVLVHTFAYHFTEEPPVTVVPEKNVAIQFCLHTPMGAAITDDTYFSKRERIKFEKWRKLSDNMFVWTYIVHHGYYYAPSGNFRALYEDTVYFLRQGVKGFFQQGRHICAPTQFGELQSFLTAKMFANPAMTYEQYRAYMKDFCLAYFGKGGEYVLQFIDLLEARSDEFNHFGKTKEEQESGKFDPYEKKEDALLVLYGEPTFVEKSLALFDKAYALAETEKEKEHVDKYRLNAEFCELAKKYLQKEEDYAQKRLQFMQRYIAHGGTEVREGFKVPPLDKIDMTKSPFRFETPTKTIALEKGVESARYFAGDSTKKENYGFGFDFTLSYQDNVLTLNLDVQDNDIFTIDENIDDWAQDCVEVYVSEQCRRTTAVGQEGDYRVRVNAHGVYSAPEEKVISCQTEKTEGGYKIKLRLKVENEKVGFDIMAHDFSKDGKYVATRYWNALAFSHAGSPANFGIIEIKK